MVALKLNDITIIGTYYHPTLIAVSVCHVDFTLSVEPVKLEHQPLFEPLCAMCGAISKANIIGIGNDIGKNW